MFVKWFRKILFTLLLGKGGEEMLAILWANQIIYKRKKFSQTPPTLKEDVRQILVDGGREDLIDE